MQRHPSHPPHTPTPLIAPLSAIPVGHTVELVAIEGGRRLRKRLADLGLGVGERVRVVQNPPVGPLILAVKEDARIAIGRGMAQNIYVRPSEHGA